MNRRDRNFEWLLIRDHIRQLGLAGFLWAFLLMLPPLEGKPSMGGFFLGVLTVTGVTGALDDRVYRTLPLSRRVFGNTIWFLGVVFPALLYAAAQLTGHLFAFAVAGVSFRWLWSPMYVAILGMGYGGALILLSVEQAKAEVSRSRSTGCIVVLALGLVGPWILPVAPEQLTRWPQLTLLIAAAILAAVSYRRRDGLAEPRRDFLDDDDEGPQQRDEVRPVFRNRSRDIASPYVKHALVSVGVLVACQLGYEVLAWWEEAPDDFVPLLAVLCALAIGVRLSPHWLGGLACLRSLPLSRGRLTFLLCLFPAVFVVTTGVLGLLMCAMRHQTASCAALLDLLLPALGISILFYALQIHFDDGTAGGFTLLVLAFLGILQFGSEWFGKMPKGPLNTGAFLVTGVVLVVAGVWIMYVSLGWSSRAYKRRHTFQDDG